ncbi:hypothetical protein [Kineococcus radiotolerans]|uniref:Uncharacterized protein n=1 Tax=Kineococcus radiotolerans (strain ATCC BAA-149 / DSM 14245 / SRS30216) TaxID=266940 RepID=A6WA30_KINRD|nr:hypothetical protein [Kineococcus radiotolerans]ABS03669.1 hypothetical protein Krad_2186 [Kineococcus radiotolerans SRS30216 = ATCC BAA-149]
MTLWWDTDMDQAIEKAEAEAQTCTSETTWPPERVTEHLGLTQAYALPDEPGDGAEVFSLMRTSDLPPTVYLDRFFDTVGECRGEVGESAELV